MLKIGIDIGGTFTDFVAFDDATLRLATAKVLTTPHAPSQAVVQGLDQILHRIAAAPNEVAVIVHGTTLATNAVIERRGAPAALMTTNGFRDVLEIARERRYDIYNILFEIPTPIVPRSRCWEAHERIGADGEIVLPLDLEGALSELEVRMRDDPVMALGVCFLNAHRNGEHERALAAAAAKRWPNLFISISSEIAPESGEYERASTVAVNAYVQPVVRKYLHELESRLASKGVVGRLFVMLSNGGLTTPQVAQQRPIAIIESGPAGGVQLTCAIARTLKRRDVVAFDMGGTTAKICLIADGEPSTCNEFEVGRLDWSKPGSGLPVKAPFIEMIEIGTGGGSIASVNSLGLVAVGPRSAGANPGPACYGLGGTLPTVTDADLVLGLLRPDGFAGGALTLSEEFARAAISQHVAKPLGITVEEAAAAIHEIANENMANAARLHAAQRGVDVATHALVAFGGAGPVHAAALARKLGIEEIVFPFAAGVASALGFLLSPATFEISRSLPQLLSEIDCERVNALLAAMEEEARVAVCGTGVAAQHVRFDYKCAMSYCGQGFTIDVACPSNRLEPESVVLLRAAFDERYRELYVNLIPDLEVQISAWRVTGRGPRPEAVGADSVASGTPLESASWRSRTGFDPVTGAWGEYRVCARAHLPVGTQVAGPAIIEEAESTIVLGEGMHAYVDAASNVIARQLVSERSAAALQMGS